ncbi:hypothetical protein BHC54_04765 [Snodgrassella alvi]|uniref:Uncharacterized protein n=1 Tax=Snodgrassella alvi TaxID=1196083 RepID=A0A2N9X7L2_9NEIS|nr:hypothetical protein BHC54_04765 [Snodgrassella alvi]
MVVGTAVLVTSFIQQVGGGIVLQGFPVGLVAAAFDSAGAVIVVINFRISRINICFIKLIIMDIYPIYYQIYQILLFYQFAILYFYKLMYNEIDF